MSTTKIIERTESEVQAAARKKGLTVGALAAKMGVTKGYLSQIATGHRRWTPKMREKVVAVLGEVPGQGKVHVRQESVDGESTYIRERARELGLTMRDVAAPRRAIARLRLAGFARPQDHDGERAEAAGGCP